MSKFNGGGIAINDTLAYYVGSIPGRKSPALYKIEGSTLTPMAYFCSAELATEALELLYKLIDPPINESYPEYADESEVLE